MELPQRVAVFPQLPPDEGITHSVRQTPRNQVGAQSHSSASQDQQQPRLTTDGQELQQQLEFQDSNLSPVLSLLPANSGMEHNFTEYSLFQQSDAEFAPLRAYPDVSMASERFHHPPQDCTTQLSDCGSLSQHPLAQTTVSEEGASNCCSLSQHSLSPGDEGRREQMAHSPLIATTDKLSSDDVGNREYDSETLSNLVGEAKEDETFFLRKDISTQHLLELLQKDVGMLSSSSAVSSASEKSVRSIVSLVCKPDTEQGVVRREGPPGEASLSEHQTHQPDRTSNPEKTLSSQGCNITMGSRSTQPDESSEALHRELLSEAERCNSRENECKSQQWKRPTSPGYSLTPYPTETSEERLYVAKANLGSVPWTGPFSAGIERIHKEQDLWSSGNHTGIDGSYLSFLPQSQSTPGVFHGPSKSNVKAKLAQLSVVESNKESSYQSNTEISPQPAVPVTEPHHPDMAHPCQDEATSEQVQSLPSVNYLQKVDAWRANQSSSKTSLFDSLALQGFSGISPKKKAYNAVSDTLNRILSQQVSSLQQPSVSSAANQNVTESTSKTLPDSSSSIRGEAVGSAPSDNDNTGSAAQPSASAFGRSQSHSSFSTVVMLMQKDQQGEKPAERGETQTEDIYQQPRTTVQPSPLTRLGQFSDVSLDKDLTISSSQESYTSEIKLGTSIGTSSVTSLEVDNYVPYSHTHTELNIEERIPLYLHNLGINQSPSSILTPFVPRGPIREPEFSPTDLSTIKGSTGIPTKSTQPSEGSIPHKGEFSRSSILSVDSSISIPFSLDSLGPAVSIPEQTRQPCPSADTETAQNKHKPAPSSQPHEESNISILPPTQQEQKDGSFTNSQNVVQLDEMLDSHLMGTNMERDTKMKCGERNLSLPLQTSRTLDLNAQDSYVSSNALWEIQKLLSQAEQVVSAGSSTASSTSPTMPRLLSDDNIVISLRKKTSRLQDSSFSSSSATGDPRIQSSLLWTRSSSDSMLTSEKQRQSSVGRENMTSSWKPGYPSTQEVVTAAAAETCKGPQDGTVRSAGSLLVLSKSAKRAEPEGCSAAPPDSKVLTQPPVKKLLSAGSTKQLPPALVDTVGVPETEEKTGLGGPVQSGSSSPIPEDPDQGVMSEGSSESSLADRVAKLLRSDSPATVVSSTTSMTDQEESKAREWIKLKISGQQCEPLELAEEDRKRIDEIKKELLLKNPMKSQGSTDTESSATSSVTVQRGHHLPQRVEAFTTLSNNNHLSQPLQSLSTELTDSSVQFQKPLFPDLEAQVCEIAVREGVVLPRTKTRALTSITIATRRRSNSSSSSTSPASPSPASEPLHLTELSADHPKTNRELLHSQDEEKTTREAAFVFEPNSSLCTRHQNQNSQLMSGIQKRQDAVGAQLDELPPPPLKDFYGSVNIKVDSAKFYKQNDELSDQNNSISGGPGAEQGKGLSSSESPGSTGHISHVHLTLSPKATDHSLATAVHSSHVGIVTGPPRKDFVPLRHSSFPVSSPDEGVGLSSPPEWVNTREHERRWGPEKTDTSTLFKTKVPQGRITSTSTQSLTPHHTPEVSQGLLTTESPAMPVLLPYKPSGSEELFYVPQIEPDVSSTGPSDTTMESSHTGSDDAVPPHFSSEVLGHQDPGLDRGVTIRHTEGIYSKRMKMATFRMQEPEHRGASHKSSQTKMSRAAKCSSQVSAAFTRVPSSSNQEASRRDQGTSPVQFLSYDQPEPSTKTFQSVHVEVDNDKATHPDVPQLESQQSSSSLDQLWQRFCEQWSLEESRPTSDREATLLERLERLSRLIHSTRATDVSEQQEQEYHDVSTTKQELGRRGDHATRKEKRQRVVQDKVQSLLYETRGVEWTVRGRRQGEGKTPMYHQAWTQSLQEGETSPPAEDDRRTSVTSSLSHSSFQSQHLFPADRDETETLSTMSGSMSTVDTARLIRVFGAHRVQYLKTSSSLSKLYSTINKQKDGREQRRGRNKNSPQIITPSETTGTDESVAADSAPSTSTYMLPVHRGPSRSLASKKALKLVNKGIQAGELEIVSNGTRRHTRDVGTTFPSPRETRALSQTSSSSSSAERGRGGQRSPSTSQGIQKQRKTKSSPSKPYPEGVSWFISADDLRSEGRKENQPDDSAATWRPSTAWFEPYSRRHPWREPLRQRQFHEDRNQQPSFRHHTEPDPDPRTKMLSSGLARISLQEALEMRRPEFISQSRQRVHRLALQVEERKLQADFTRERNGLFNQHGGPGRLPRPADTALFRRAVPRKEMIQRSKQIYENLPEVQRRREEERRMAEYRSYRLNAQLYNKRITNRVLGRRAAWQ
ncbi:mucin-4 [Mastacembelus armatus]|uniref:mucin-4 n=1 Tax=Mastacembelus armatus TaxID=205130 RepID=UPI000E45A5C5|nr:Alstrom syndrome protein 1 [Mastacembelus armatus]